MKIRKATPADIIPINGIYSVARQFMQQTGNPNQWINGYPSEELILEDIKKGDAMFAFPTMR